MTSNLLRQRDRGLKEEYSSGNTIFCSIFFLEQKKKEGGRIAVIRCDFTSADSESETRILMHFLEQASTCLNEAGFGKFTANRDIYQVDDGGALVLGASVFLPTVSKPEY